MSRPEVVVSAAGCVGPWGSGMDALRAVLASGELNLSQVDRSAGFHRLAAAESPGAEQGSRSAQMAGLLGSNPYSPWLSPREARRMSPASRMAVCSARMAIDAAKVDGQDLANASTAVCLGTGFGSTNYASALLQQVHDQGPLSISPLLFMETVANAHAGQVALALGATGSNVTLSQREASALLATARGANLIEQGRAERVLAGAVDEVSPILHAMLDRFGALAHATSDFDLERSRVFDAARNGFHMSEGGTTFFLESRTSAEARGLQPLATIRASARATDPTASTADWGHGHEELARRLCQALARLGVEMGSIDLVVSGANGSRRGDRLEARVLRDAFGETLPPILAPKSVTGEYGGGFIASALLAFEAETWASTPGFETTDPELGVCPALGQAIETPRRILVTTLAAGGAACWLVLDRPSLS